MSLLFVLSTREVDVRGGVSRHLLGSCNLKSLHTSAFLAEFNSGIYQKPNLVDKIRKGNVRGCMMQVRPTASQRRKLKQLHWDKIKAPQEGTIWHQASALNPNLNFAELESLFQVSFSYKLPACAHHVANQRTVPLTH